MPKTMNDTAPIHITVTNPMKDKLLSLAQDSERNLSAYCRFVLIKHLKELENNIKM